MTATILLIIGTSSAGKTTLAEELQAFLPEHYLLFGLDDVFRMVSPRWGGGLAGPLSYDGFRYHYTPTPPTTTIQYGDVGRAVLNGMRQAVAAFAQAGTNVIIDEMLLERDIINSWAVALAPYQTYLIKVQAPLATLEQREAQRGHPRGLARGHEAANDIPVFDRLIDTIDMAPKDAASELARWLEVKPQPLALQQYRT
jgi:chloramphenicol 3-O phosphotransferase